MKKLWVVLVLLLLTGCRADPVYETVADVPAEPVMAEVSQVFVQWPEDVSTPTGGQTENQIYLGDGYTLTLHTLAGGDLNKTVQNITGFDVSQLQMIESRKGVARRIDLVWTSAGEEELEVCRACILDDGNYHYVLSAMTPESRSGELQQTLRPVFDSFRLVDGDWQINTGS